MPELRPFPKSGVGRKSMIAQAKFHGLALNQEQKPQLAAALIEGLAAASLANQIKPCD